MASSNAFKPLGLTRSITTGVASANNTALRENPMPGASVGTPGNCLRVFNNASVPCFVRWGSGPPSAAVLTDFPIAPGAVEVFQVEDDTSWFAAILPSGTGTLYGTLGEGV